MITILSQIKHWVLYEALHTTSHWCDIVYKYKRCQPESKKLLRQIPKEPTVQACGGGAVVAVVGQV